MFLSIINDYDLRTGLCELVDNALDLWQLNNSSSLLKIEVTLDPDRQCIEVKDNAGGVSEDQAELLIAPGATRQNSDKPLIGIFGVGGKRAGVALGELVEIRTRHAKGKSIQIDISADWISTDDWDLEIFEIPDIASGTTSVTISKVRQSFGAIEVDKIKADFCEIYGRFIGSNCSIRVNETEIVAKKFDVWAYPPNYLPRTATFPIEPTAGKQLSVTLSGGLIQDRIPEAENYGVYFYCNNRLIVKELKNRDVGYHVSAEAGVPHPDASISRVIVEYIGAPELMPWNSSKSDINYSHPAFIQIRNRIIDFNAYYTGLSRRLKHAWDSEVFKHTEGKVQRVQAEQASSEKKKILPKLPASKRHNHLGLLKELNKQNLQQNPWTVGLVEVMGFLDIVDKQKFDTKYRISLILLDSNLEIAMKEFIVHRKDVYPAHLSMAETKCARWRRKSVPVWLIKKGCDALGSVCLV